MFIYHLGLLFASRNSEPASSADQYDEFGLKVGEKVDDEQLEKNFHSASNFIQTVAKEVPQEDLLYLYARYKQATCGPAKVSDRPTWLFDLKARKKFDAWKELGGMFRAEAMAQYVAKVGKLNFGWNPDLIETNKQASSGGFGMRPSRMKSDSEISESNNKEVFEDEEKILRAVKKGDESSVKLLLHEQPGLINVKDKNGMALLHWASDIGIQHVVQSLIMHGAEINERDNEGQTPLHYAASNTYPEIVQLLLDNNADPTIPDNEEKTPVDVADDPQVIEIFEIYMGHI